MKTPETVMVSAADVFKRTIWAQWHDRPESEADVAIDEFVAAAIKRARHDIIARRAYALYVARGCQHGHDLEDWLQAESELLHGQFSHAAQETN